MKFAPHIGLSSTEDFMFPVSAGSDPIDQIKFIADQGFSGIEDNFLKMKRDRYNLNSHQPVTVLITRRPRKNRHKKPESNVFLNF